MTEILLLQLLDTIRATRGAYHRLTVIAGPTGSGKTSLLRRIADQLGIPIINLSLLLSEQLLSHTRQQRALKAEEVAIEVIDEHLQSGLCLDNTELLFDSGLRLNPLALLQEVSRNRLIVATWNGTLTGGELRFAYPGHPDFFRQQASGYPVISVVQGKFQLYLTT